MKKNTHRAYEVSASIWLYPGDAAWHFVTIPKQIAAEITLTHGAKKRGWGSLRVSAHIGKTVWDTSIFPDKKSGTYLLPLKAEVRRQERLEAGDRITLSLTIR